MDNNQMNRLGQNFDEFMIGQDLDDEAKELAAKKPHRI
jgi:hypothetical protein